MAGAADVFGTTGDGQPVRRVVLHAGGLTATIITYGAIIQDLRLDGHDAPLVLGYDSLAEYVRQANYMGSVVGRHANRIRDGRFLIGGERYQIDAAHPQAHGLHGGSEGYASRNWTMVETGPDFVTLALTDPDGTMGFPGTVEVTCTYRLRAPGTLGVELSATTDRATLVNLAQHSYFNLDDGGATETFSHRMAIKADAYLPVDEALIPTGEVRPVAGTDWDFRSARPIGAAASGEPERYDHNFCLAAARGPLRQAVWLQGAHSGVEMELWTTEPGVQFYAGHFIAPGHRGLGGITYRPFGGICLEPQVWPDSPNKPYFPQAVLSPGETYRQLTEFRFSLS
jgi:aldose 1-epimerase